MNDIYELQTLIRLNGSTAIRKTRRDSEHQNFLQELGIPTIMNKQRRDIRNSELQFFSFRSVVSTTNNFADNCKLGEGGFGPVYKVCIFFSYVV